MKTHARFFSFPSCSVQVHRQADKNRVARKAVRVDLFGIAEISNRCHVKRGVVVYNSCFRPGCAFSDRDPRFPLSQLSRVEPIRDAPFSSLGILPFSGRIWWMLLPIAAVPASGTARRAHNERRA
jgi:hypothetical protein